MFISDNRYTEKHRVHTHHCDINLQARLPYYFQLVQEGAATHAMLAGCSNPDFEKIGKAWVLSRIKMKINSFISWNEYITLQTWIQPPLRFFAPREARGIDDHGNELFRTMAYWVIIDIDSRKPERSQQFLDKIGLSEDRTLWSEEKISKVPLPPETEPSVCFVPQIQYRDIDSVRHVNHISYIEWIIESLSPDITDRYQVEEFEIHFTAESFPEDVLEVKSWQTDKEKWIHSVLKKTPQGPVETCRACSTWKPRRNMR